MKLAESMLAVVGAAIAATTGLGSAGGAAKLVHLFKNDIDPDETSVLTDFEEAEFGGYGAIALEEAVGTLGLDPLSGEYVVRVDQAAGGQFFTSSGDFDPETIYGAYITDDAGTSLLAFLRFATPILVNASGQIIDVPDVEVRFGGVSFK